ncbi:MAG: DUF5615 family PIN-like protein [Spirulina sp.]
MNILYQADADFNQIIVTGVRRRESTIDFQTASEANLQGVSDFDVLALAAKQNRILVTHDRRTMPLEFAEFITHQTSAGVLIVSKKLAVEIVIDELILIWSVSTAEDWIDRIAKIPL